jgi:AraC family transcriptional regulator of adaptative response/methylated-DNA-[protein]-cysteine methyltransferase
MLFTPSPDELYDALVRRDEAFDGRAFVGVTSTGIFCRLTCPARKPKRENCQFFETVAQCVEAGYRACKRCHPMQAAAKREPVIRDLMARLDADTRRRWTEGDIIRLGHDPSTVRRAFKRHYGMTFLEIARLYRLRDGFEALAGGERVIDAQLSAGFESGSGFRQAFARLAGKAPFAFTGQEVLKAHWLDTPLGPMIAVADDAHLHLLEFADRKALPGELKKLERAAGGIGIGETRITTQITAELEAFFDGRCAQFDTPLKLHGSAFTREIWRELIRIPAGATRSYLQLAEAIGNPNATRAVARANGANQIAIVIPCHRVIGADGSLTGYGGGLWRKQKLIELEQQYAKGHAT